MSSPNTAYESCSRLSAYLAWGCISIRCVVQDVRAAAGVSMPKIAARAFLSRCHWHCHFMQKLESEPTIEQHAFNRACDDLRPQKVDTLPIVEHRVAVHQVRAHFAALRKREDYWQCAREVMRRHGSRKTSKNQNRPKRPKRKTEPQIELPLNHENSN